MENWIPAFARNDDKGHDRRLRSTTPFPYTPGSVSLLLHPIEKLILQFQCFCIRFDYA